MHQAIERNAGVVVLLQHCRPEAKLAVGKCGEPRGQYLNRSRPALYTVHVHVNDLQPFLHSRRQNRVNLIRRDVEYRVG